jgi:hypothetical protein
MQKSIHLRALTMLGALMLYFFLWPICCCAAKPAWSPSSSDDLSASEQFVDLIQGAKNNRSGADASVNQYELIESDAVTLTDKFETMTTTTSVYELFDPRRGRRKSRVLSRTDRSVNLNSANSRNNSVSGAKRVRNIKTKPSKLDRNERSANLSHITGSARKIQLYIKNRFLQLLPDGTVNGTTEDTSDFSKFSLLSRSRLRGLCGVHAE